MKIRFYFPFLLALAVVFFNSCSVQKRIHRKGWHVEWRQNFKKDIGVESGDRETAIPEKKSHQRQVITNTIASEKILIEEPHASSTLTSNEVQSAMDSSPETVPSSNEPLDVKESHSEPTHSTAQLRRLHTEKTNKVQAFALLLVIAIVALVLLLLLVVTLGAIMESSSFVTIIMLLGLLIAFCFFLLVFVLRRASQNLKKERELSSESKKEEKSLEVKSPEEKAKSTKKLIFLGCFLALFFILLAALI